MIFHTSQPPQNSCIIKPSPSTTTTITFNIVVPSHLGKTHSEIPSAPPITSSVANFSTAMTRDIFWVLAKTNLPAIYSAVAMDPFFLQFKVAFPVMVLSKRPFLAPLESISLSTCYF